MPPAGLGERVGREIHVFGLGFLKAQRVDVVAVQELEDERQAEPDGIDVPSCYAHGCISRELI